MVNTSQTLQIRQSQSLVMTQQMQQAIKLLQLSNAELSDYLTEISSQNPLLKVGDNRSDSKDYESESSHASGSGETSSDPNATKTSGHKKAELEALISSNARTVSWERLTGADKGYRGNEEDTFDPTQNLTDAPSLTGHLLAQVHLEIENPSDRLIAAILIDNLDGAGYFRGNLTDIAFSLGTDTARITSVFDQCRKFDPAGIFANSLADCLKLQLLDRVEDKKNTPKNSLPKAMQTLLDNLGLLADAQLGRLAKLCETDEKTLHSMIGQIRSLDPKPATKFSHQPAQTLIPDVIISRIEGDSLEEGKEAADNTHTNKDMNSPPLQGWRIDLNSDTLPRALANRAYFSTLIAGARSKDDQRYVKDCWAGAAFIVRAMDNRAETILKVAEELVRSQEGFLLHGISHMRPLGLKDVALALGINESTVSRVTAGKYMATPRGVFEMKYFFHQGLNARLSSQDSQSSESIRHRIKQLVDSENQDTILSDDMIVRVLKAEGTVLARRTVAKYREQLNIPPSSRRKRLQALAG